MSESRIDRRTLLKNALIGAAALPTIGPLLSSHKAAAQASLPHVQETESLAKSLGYVHDHNKVDAKTAPQFKKGSKCSNCIQVQGKDGEAWRPCNLFPGKLVAAAGWCNVWTIKPGAKI